MISSEDKIPSFQFPRKQKRRLFERKSGLNLIPCYTSPRISAQVTTPLLTFDSSPAPAGIVPVPGLQLQARVIAVFRS